MELRQLESFVAVATYRSFTRAARTLAFDQSTISRHVAGLERDLGLVLLRRTNRDVALTEAGHRWLPQARRVLESARRARDLADRIADLQGGTERRSPEPYLHEAPRAAELPRR
ncbi:MAG: putative LysR-family transcriptional regulator [Frankiales bacterium]|nr:putative LysR-family transcriptional regulator [Frankiales bacterium]